MIVEWSRQAIDELDVIYNNTLDYTQSAEIAERVYRFIICEAAVLQTFPQAGSIELLLGNIEPVLRSLVVRKCYKLIYYIGEESVHIVDVWDCRKTPSSLVKRIK